MNTDYEHAQLFFIQLDCMHNEMFKAHRLPIKKSKTVSHGLLLQCGSLA